MVLFGLQDCSMIERTAYQYSIPAITMDSCMRQYSITDSIKDMQTYSNINYLDISDIL